MPGKIGAVGFHGITSSKSSRATPKEIKTVNDALNKDGKKYPSIKALIDQDKSYRMTIDFGRVTRVLPPDTEGIPHQIFILKTDDGAVVKVAHNTALAPPIKYIKPGMRLGIKGEFIQLKDLKAKTPDELHSMGITFDPLAGLLKHEKLDGVVHWTHHTPSNSNHDNGGLVVLDPGPNYGKIYD